MIDQTQKNKLHSELSILFEKKLIDEIASCCHLKTIVKDTELIGYDQPIISIPFILEGSIKIFREDVNGNELLLYYIESGETCALSLTCTVSNKLSSIRAVAEEDSTLVLIPKDKMDEWMNTFSSWRKFIVASYQIRFNELLSSIDDLAFKSLDERLWKYLVDKVKINSNLEIHLSHKVIADELNSSRVVISRLLKILENKGQLVLHRNKIELKGF